MVTARCQTSKDNVKRRAISHWNILSDYKTFHQIRKYAIGAKSVGMIAEIVEDLEEALLAGGGFQPMARFSAQQSLTSQPQ